MEFKKNDIVEDTFIRGILLRILKVNKLSYLCLFVSTNNKISNKGRLSISIEKGIFHTRFIKVPEIKAQLLYG